MAKKEIAKKTVFNVSIGFVQASKYKFKKKEDLNEINANALVKKAWKDKATRQVNVSRKLVNV